MSDSVTDGNGLVDRTYLAMVATWEWYLAGLRCVHPDVSEHALRVALGLMFKATGGDPIRGDAMLAELVRSFRAAGFTAPKPVTPKAETVRRLEQELRQFARRRRRATRG